jgi:hypothetical protein
VGNLYKLERLKIQSNLLTALPDSMQSFVLLEYLDASDNLLAEVRRRVFLRCHFCVKTIISPRQARDKHRESTQKESDAFAYSCRAGLPTRNCVT